MTNTFRVRPHWTDLTALALVGLTAVVSLGAFPRLQGEMVVGWHVGLDGAVSRTVGPRLLGVALFPTLAAACYVVLRTARSLAGLDSLGERRIYDASTLFLMATLAACQLALVVANLG